MKKFLLIWLGLGLTACGGIPTVQVPKNGVIALIYETGNYICHDHSGGTVFQNFVTYYDLPDSDIEKAIFDGYKAGFSKLGYRVVRANKQELFGNIALNSATELTTDQKQHLVSSANLDGYDLVLVAETLSEVGLTETTPPIEKKNYCEGGVILFTGRGDFRADVLAFSMDTTAFDGLTGNNYGRLHYNEHPSFSARAPKNLEELSQLDLEHFLEDLSQNAEYKAVLISRHLTSSSN